MTDQDRHHFRLYMQSRWEDRHPGLKPPKPDYFTLFILACSLITIAANVLTLLAYK